jgi:hypothetical protein
VKSSFEFQLEIPTFLVLPAVRFISVVCKLGDERVVQKFDRISLLVDLVLQAVSTNELIAICCTVLRDIPFKILRSLFSSQLFRLINRIW